MPESFIRYNLESLMIMKSLHSNIFFFIRDLMRVKDILWTFPIQPIWKKSSLKSWNWKRKQKARLLGKTARWAKGRTGWPRPAATSFRIVNLSQNVATADEIHGRWDCLWNLPTFSNCNFFLILINYWNTWLFQYHYNFNINIYCISDLSCKTERGSTEIISAVASQ